ncbi:SHOCT domain-containing protein [Kribbella sp. NPDC004875]|uniref:SHOCT domain-containing protein n=1 Tax=Kribbella sp. NPDC004875 TaxID=3364107 RepID=UPI0036C96FED
MMHSGSNAVFWTVTVVVAWVLVSAVAAGIAIRLLRPRRRQPPPTLPSPLDILERRFAAGEITREDFDEARARLREHELDL